MTDLNINIEQMTDFLVNLLEIPSPTGYHVEIMPFVEKVFTELDFPNTTITTTNKGAVLVHIKGENDDAPIGITAHVDTLGFMVKEIKGNGRLKMTNLGGINWAGAEFENCTVRTHDNQRIRGTVLLANPSTHVNRDAHKTTRNSDSMEVRLDARTTSRKETEALGIGVGDFIFLDTRIEIMETGFIRSRFLDDKAGLAVIYGALASMKSANVIPSQDTYILVANYEEVGHGGSAGFPANIAEVLSIDMGAIGEGQAGDEFSVSICVKDGGGPYHFDMNNKLRRLCDDHNIDYNVDIYVYYSSDGTAFWRAGGDAKVGLAGPGVASSHGYERTHKDALLHSAHLIARYMLD
ncbi:MAG: M42 family metallopeptidase [Chloroflexota bacterium]